MRCCCLLLLAAGFGGMATTAQAQILIGPPPGYGYSGYASSRVGVFGGLRIGVGFGGSPYAPIGVSSTRITIVTIAPPPYPFPRPIRFMPPPEETPNELPNLPVDRIRRAPKEPPPPRIEPKVPAPIAELALRVRLGREAFEAEEYGRAAQRFREANRLRPDEPLPYFYLAQALVAVGKYHEALDAILAGMAKQPDWPAERFVPIDLYGGGVAEYPEHLLRLDEALKKHPHDPALLFLNGYQVWFAGRREAATPLFRQARDRLAGKPGAEALRAACERFLAEIGR